MEEQERLNLHGVNFTYSTGREEEKKPEENADFRYQTADIDSVAPETKPAQPQAPANPGSNPGLQGSYASFYQAYRPQPTPQAPTQPAQPGYAQQNPYAQRPTGVNQPVYTQPGYVQSNPYVAPQTPVQPTQPVQPSYTQPNPYAQRPVGYTQPTAPQPANPQPASYSAQPTYTAGYGTQNTYSAPNPYAQPTYAQRNPYVNVYGQSVNPYQYAQPTSTEAAKPKTEKKKSGKGLVVFLSLIAFVLSTVISSSVASNAFSKNIQKQFSFPTVVSEEDLNQQAKDYQSISDIIEDVSRSVVTITTTVVSGTGIFATEGEALGSGVIIGEEADIIYIATNYHVIDGANSVSILLGADESAVVKAYHQGSDEDADLAVIYVKKSDIPENILKQIKIATLGSSSAMKLGDLVIAIGNPVDKEFGLSASAGIVSGLNRSVTMVEDGIGKTMTLLQTDAAINPGNSGGALVNGRGEVIGINNAKLVSEDVEGICFAIPIDIAKPLLEKLIVDGRIVRPYIGIVGTDVTNWAYYKEYNLVYGVWVQSVVERGPADRAGIMAYDVIIDFNGEEIQTMTQLQTLIQACSPGDKVEVTLLRGYMDNNPQTVRLTMTIGDKTL